MEDTNAHNQQPMSDAVRQANANADLRQLATEHTGNGTRWHSTSTGAVLADSSGRIIGSVKRLNGDGHYVAGDGYTYINMDSAKSAVEATAAGAFRTRTSDITLRV